MRVAIAGAGSVGRSIAERLLEDEHTVLLIERLRSNFRPGLVRNADWMLADACELETLQKAAIHTCDVVVAATGDDKANLVFALLCKTECSVPRVVARVNHPKNRWMFTEAWGVDVAVSTPSALVSLVEEAVTVGELVQVMTLQQGHGNIVAINLPDDTALAGTPVRTIALPSGAALLSIRRDGAIIAPTPEIRLQGGDEVILVATADVEEQIRAAILG